ncbi:MAG: nucleotidyltransferase domain-containing protein [Candidatus Hydrogenedentota bacterium]
MNIEYYPEDKLKKEIMQIIRKHLDADRYKVFFFGSRVKGDNFIHADIDIGIEGDEPIPASSKLEIIDELDNLPTLYRIDFIDFKVVSDKFKNEALKYSERIDT